MASTSSTNINHYYADDKDIILAIINIVDKIKDEVARSNLLLDIEETVISFKRGNWKERVNRIARILMKLCSNGNLKNEIFKRYSTRRVERTKIEVLHEFLKASVEFPLVEEEETNKTNETNETNETKKLVSIIGTHKYETFKDAFLGYLGNIFPELRCFTEFDAFVKKFPNTSDWAKKADNRVKSLKSRRTIEDLTMLAEHERFCFLYGDVQSGKTKSMVAICANYLLHGKSTIFVVSDKTSHCDQLMNSFANHDKLLKEYIEKLGFNHKVSLNVLFAKNIDSNRRQRTLFKDAMNGVRPAVIIALANSAQISRVNRMIAEHCPENFRDFVVVVDEADKILYPVGESTKKQDSKQSYQEAIEQLQEQAGKIFAVSATPYEIFVRKDSLTPANLLCIQKSKRHIGLFELRTKKLMYDTCPTSNVDKPMYEQDENFIPHYKKIIEDGTIDGFCGSMPSISLHTTTKFIKPMFSTQDAMKTHPILSPITTITYTGEGVRIVSNKFGEEPLKMVDGLTGKIMRSTYENGAHIFNKAQIQDALQMLKTNGGVKRFPYIVIFSGNMANRGVNFVSRDFEWHCAYQYYVPSRGTTIPEMLQTLRVCGIFKDAVQPTIFAPKWSLVELKIGYGKINQTLMELTGSDFLSNPTPDEQFERIKRQRLTPVQPMIRDVVRNMKFNVKKRTRSKMCRDQTHVEVYIEEEDSVPMSKYQKELDKIEESGYEKVTKRPRHEDINKRSQITMDVAAHKRLTEKMFPKWAKDSSSKIARFMEQLEPTKVYTKFEIMKVINESGVNRLKLLMTEKINDAGAYGLLIKEDKGKYMLYPELVDAYKMYF